MGVVFARLLPAYRISAGLFMYYAPLSPTATFTGSGSGSDLSTDERMRLQLVLWLGIFFLRGSEVAMKNTDLVVFQIKSPCFRQLGKHSIRIFWLQLALCQGVSIM